MTSYFILIDFIFRLNAHLRPERHDILPQTFTKLLGQVEMNSRRSEHRQTRFDRRVTDRHWTDEMQIADRPKTDEGQTSDRRATDDIQVAD